MTFDDGIVKIITLKNIAEKGNLPKYELVVKEEHYYHEEKIGITRHYTAKSHDQTVDLLISIPEYVEIDKKAIVAVGDITYSILLVQHDYDDINLRITTLTLQKEGDGEYENIDKT